MKNLLPITTKEALLSYKQKIKDNCCKTLSLWSHDKFPNKLAYLSMDIEILRPTLESISKLGIPLCVHGETKGFLIDREKEFLPIYESLAINFPNLKTIMEHISTKEAITLLDKYDNLYATVTIHHLLLTIDDVVGGILNPHNFCKPIIKKDKDKDALQKVVLEAHPKIMFGSDSAPKSVIREQQEYLIFQLLYNF